MSDKIEYTATSESIYEYLYLLQREAKKGEFTDQELKELIVELENNVVSLKSTLWLSHVNHYFGEDYEIIL